jgi:hypothetical protein
MFPSGMPEGRENKKKGTKARLRRCVPSIGGGVPGPIYHVPFTNGFTEWEGCPVKIAIKKSDYTAPDFDMRTTIGIIDVRKQ